MHKHCFHPTYLVNTLILSAVMACGRSETKSQEAPTPSPTPSTLADTASTGSFVFDLKGMSDDTRRMTWRPNMALAESATFLFMEVAKNAHGEEVPLRFLLTEYVTAARCQAINRAGWDDRSSLVKAGTLFYHRALSDDQQHATLNFYFQDLSDDQLCLMIIMDQPEVFGETGRLPRHHINFDETSPAAALLHDMLSSLRLSSERRWRLVSTKIGATVQFPLAPQETAAAIVHDNQQFSDQVILHSKELRLTNAAASTMSYTLSLEKTMGQRCTTFKHDAGLEKLTEDTHSMNGQRIHDWDEIYVTKESVADPNDRQKYLSSVNYRPFFPGDTCLNIYLYESTLSSFPVPDRHTDHSDLAMTAHRIGMSSTLLKK